jgi:SAM-dependent methyltransferase
MADGHPSGTGSWTASYWEARLSRDPDLRGTGHRGFSLAYNNLMYEVASRRLRACLGLAGVSLRGASILEVGPGLGYFVQKYLDWGAGAITGIELTEVGCRSLRTRFPEIEIVHGDICMVETDLVGEHDLVSVISVIYHIVEDPRFERALETLCNCVKPGGYLLIVDAFERRLFPSAKHAKMRSMGAYDRILQENGFTVERVTPMYYLMGRTLLPLVGPMLFSHPAAASWLARLEDRLASRFSCNAGGLKYMLARKHCPGCDENAS